MLILCSLISPPPLMHALALSRSVLVTNADQEHIKPAEPANEVIHNYASVNRSFTFWTVFMKSALEDYARCDVAPSFYSLQEPKSSLLQ